MAHEPSRLWWLAVDGQPQGPYSTDRIALDLQIGRVFGGSMVCPVDGGQWGAAASFQEFQLFPGATSQSLPGGRASERLLQTAGWYELVGVPCLKILTWIASAQLPDTFEKGTLQYRQEYFVNLVSEVVFLILMLGGCVAGVKLLQRRRDGIGWMTAVVAGQWIVGLIAIGLMVLISASVPEGTVDSSAEPTSFVKVTFILCLGLLLLACLFEIVALVWLWCFRPFLPRTPNI